MVWRDRRPAGVSKSRRSPGLIRFEFLRWRPNPSQVRVRLGLQEQRVVKWTRRSHIDSVFDDPHMVGKII